MAGVLPATTTHTHTRNLIHSLFSFDMAEFNKEIYYEAKKRFPDVLFFLAQEIRFALAKDRPPITGIRDLLK